MKVFVVIHGAYSDQSVEGVYTTIELAEKSFAPFDQHDYSIEEVEMDAPADYPPGMKAWRVYLVPRADSQSYVGRAPSFVEANRKQHRVFRCGHPPFNSRLIDAWNNEKTVDLWAVDEADALAKALAMLARDVTYFEK